MKTKKNQGYHGIQFQHFHNADIHPETSHSLAHSGLEQILNTLQEHYHILPARKWMEKALQQDLHPLEVCLTFDDGLLCQYEVALPLLEAHGLTAFWFVPTAPLKGEWIDAEMHHYFQHSFAVKGASFQQLFRDVLEQSPYAEEAQQALSNLAVPAEMQTFSFLKNEVLGPKKFANVMEQLLKKQAVDKAAIAKKYWMTAEHIQQLHQTGHVVGLHSHSHPRQLADLTKQQQLREYQQNQLVLADILGETPRCMAHPHNSYNQDTLEVLQTLDIQLGFCNNSIQLAPSNLEQARVPQTFWMNN